jgi:hypothetical protein
MANTSPSPCPLSFEEVPELLLLCFEAAADAAPPCPLAYAIEGPTATTGMKSVLVWRTEDLLDPPCSECLHSLSFPPASLPAALARYNMCNYFAFLLESEVKERMRVWFGAKVEWKLVDPLPHTALFRHYTTELQPLRHSVLMITEQDGSCWVMDGTPEQFGWDRESWLLPYAEFSSKRMATKTATHITNRERFGIGRRLKDIDRGFWAVAKERMEDLLANLPWHSLLPLPRKLRVELVELRAKGAFSGAYGEAIIRAMVM